MYRLLSADIYSALITGIGAPASTALPTLSPPKPASAEHEADDDETGLRINRINRQSREQVQAAFKT